MKTLFRFISLLVFSFISVVSFAQSAGDRLFSEGQKLQMTQTVKSQNLAIKKFEAAKRA